ncbi:RHS repeat domain-containing protein [Hymenobacter elongatus]|uniref:RHS repeat-associated core domain-containing protein n=1 Tax=Hymenobacter elongatus TaxID=877208 RepID=A0A4Z0PQT4_9BACT|nr:RHS repeat domain-containing protein [Hymenobacter elongatus]TGE17545.1 hypothetical protein E5J99_06745 [Hymenobacter elongatus]
MKFLYRPRIIKAIASFLLLEVVTQLVAPAASYALTSGPTVPEATSFEPVDTTDMVDLASGDFTYNIPLLEVPGPEGGYPLALSYHAGIQPNEEASWVGLGWSLNPGAINRNVNGFADDHENITQTRRDYWSGGQTSTTSVGVTVGIPGTPASVSFGLSFSQDTYRGFGVGTNIGIGSSFEMGPASIGASASVYTDGYGNSGAGVGVGVSVAVAGNVSASLGVSASTSGGFGVNAGLGYSDKASKMSASILGVSMNSGSSTPSLSVGGGSAMVESGRAGIIQTEVSSFGVSIPFPGGSVNLRQSDVRYWSDETVDVLASGSIYFPKQFTPNVWNSSTSSYTFDNKAFDTYRLSDPENANIYEHPDPNWLLGGSFADYDNYMVSGQGIAGSMRPYVYQAALYSQNKVVPNVSSRHHIIDYPLPWDNKPAFFRFENDFSNQYRQTSTGTLTSGPYSYGGQNYDDVRYNFDNQAQHGENNTLGYDASNDRIAGSKSIEYYTNQQIKSGIAKVTGFIDQSAKGFARDNNSQIGGFSVTNASGVTYHYALPVYSFNELFYMQKVGSSGSNLTYNRLSKPQKYAYTWYLTAVTGPDYVDINNDGLAGQGDWGYWAVFNYGKWSTDYKWRNPSEGYHRDADASFESYSKGMKELYYLNSVATRTHTALFVKSFRADGKGAADGNGGSRPFAVTPAIGCTPTGGGGCRDPYWRCAYPAIQLKLDKVITLKNEDVPANVENQATTYNINNVAYSSNGVSFSTSGRRFLGENILDVADVASLSSITVKSINSTVFSYNYSLSPGTVNSWDETGTFYTSSDLSSPSTSVSNTPPLFGKLTLNQIQTFGLGGNGAMPPTKFGYELSQEEKSSTSITVGEVINSKGYVMLGDENPFREGDLLEFIANGRRVCCALVKSEGGIHYLARYIGYSPPSGTYTASLTKNPPYSKDNYDMWGMFKSDFNTDLTSLSGFDETMGRATSEVSAKSTDVWSLRSIQTPLGAILKVKYEGDKYQAKLLKRPNMIAGFGYGQAASTGNHTPASSTGRIALGNRLVVPASSVFKVGQRVMISGLFTPNDPSRNFRGVYDVPVTITQIEDLNSSLGSNIIYVRDDTGQLWQPATNIPRQQLYLGHVKLSESNNNNYGGGLRVQNISVSTFGLDKTTRYNYENNELPSGVTSYEPGSYLPVNEADFAGYISASTHGGMNSNEMSSARAAASTTAKAYKINYYSTLPTLLSLTRILPAPGVMYEYVTVRDEIKRANETEKILPQTTVYQFEVIKPNMVSLLPVTYTSGAAPTSSKPYRVMTREVAIHDFTTRVGRLKRRTSYYSTDESGRTSASGKNLVKLSETVNHYLHDEFTNAGIGANVTLNSSGYTAKLGQYGYIGMVQETFADSRKTQIPGNEFQYDRKVIMSSRKTYPVILTGTTTTDYKTNTSVTTENRQFDFLSGEVTSMLTTDSYGNRMLSESTPAYRKYPTLGPKMGANGNRNMLTQSAGSAQFKVDAQGNKQGLLSATAQTWSTSVPVLGTAVFNPEYRDVQTSVWRPQATYSWLPINSTIDGLTPLTGAGAYTDFFTGGAVAPWKKTSQVTLYDVFSAALEATDINGKYAATKKGYDRSRVLLSGAPASYNELAYTGLEDVGSVSETINGGIKAVWPDWATSDAAIETDASQTTTIVHTGIKSLLLKPQKHGMSYDVPIASVQTAKAYRASVWSNRPEAQLYYWVDGVERSIVSGNTQKQANGWYLLELTIPPIGAGHQTLRVGCYNSSPTTNVYLDDFRFQPIDAQTTAYVYDKHTGKVTHLLDNNNLYTRYEYDAAGRLTKTYRETFKYQPKLVNEVAYQYGLSRPALDGITLAVSPPSNSRTVQVSLSLPAALSSNRVIQYNPGSGTAYTTVSSVAFPYTYSAAGTYWMRVRVTDAEGKQRELVSKVIVP